ncbi:Dna2-domain-containing protein [Roridomyces roridus]|uniref:DNA replication ATP-dependent helicase/nuclease DNA2 n=1 Tax=Roridomyces roridus TaxID=1738132 RepID=A0AAD7FYE4_9AGAR|nr:Dna2-domain-containing protein [Roridomyces roridus]
MPPAARTAAEEAEFMKGLLADLDDTMDAPPPTTPAKPLPARSCSHALPATPTKLSSHKPAPKPLTPGDVDMTALLEGAEDWDWSDMHADFLSPVKKSPLKKSLAAPARAPLQYTRCTVQSVSEITEGGRLQKYLVVNLKGRNDPAYVTLKDEWARTDVREGDIVNILGSFTSSNSSISITSGENFLILHPDLLLTPSVLSNALECRRKPLLTNLVRSVSDTSPALVWGNILHEVMQACLLASRWEDLWVDDKIEEVIRQHISDIAKINLSVEDARHEIKQRARGLKAFSEKYISDTPKPQAILTNTRSVPGETSLLAISELLDIEEDICSPIWGLKGKIDATVQALISDAKPQGKTIVTSGPKPFEIKTGRPVVGLEHRAQTMLYGLLAEERYGVEVSSGLLFYTQSEEVVRVPVTRNDVKGLMGARNELAAYMARRIQKRGSREEAIEDAEPFLPPTIDDERVCKRCFSLDSCMLYRKAVENVVDKKSPIADIYDMKTGHITPTQAAFFKKWEALLTLEEQDAMRFKKELWTMTAAEREAKGRCLGNMVRDSSYSASAAPNSKFHEFTYKFCRADPAASLLNGNINVGDPITVSIEPNLLGLAKGYVLELTPTSVVVGVDHELVTRLSHVSPIFRIDKDDIYGGMGRLRDNLAHLFYADGDSRRLELVVDLKPPVFEEEATLVPPHLARFTQHLNPNQMEAVHKVLSARDYAMILGMPGTGKTTVIAAIIKLLVGMGKTVLLSSYTHSAVDTILLKLKGKVDFSILRLGNADKVHPEVQEFTLAARRVPTTVEQLEHQIMSPPVVATTCLSLPPLVRNQQARRGGLDVSLFRRLSEAHPQSVVNMAHQYRMNEDIMALSNRLIYEDRLRCGSEVVAKQALRLPDRGFLNDLHVGKACHSSGCWIEKLMAESCKAVFVDTDAVPAQDSRVGDLVQNEVEANLVYQVAETLLRSGVPPEEIGIISVYRQQLKLIGHLLSERKDVELLTADRSQGRDKECIVISLVRSNDTGFVGDLIKDWRRMNVSFTRARSKLIIFGSRKTLRSAPLLQDFFELMEGKGWILPLPPNADGLHPALCGGSVKRGAETMEGKENPPLKKAKVKEGLLRGRPILRDLVNEAS